ncbi:MAG TPA: protein kinase [Vicinamibacterales bacterium]|nr:protein kinase [Vicinamibacterales bacterium]
MLSPGYVIDGRYEILGPLGAGGMGQIYRARRVRLGDEVALKALLSADGGPEAAERFLRESRACAQLRHPNIVSILDFDVDAERRPFLVMELLSGPSLRDEIDLGGALGVTRTMEVLGVVASAVQLAHDHGITHRDLKPANVVAHRYGSGERVYKVIDFGLASLAAPPDATRLTLPFTFLGTIAYSPPEQLAGEAVGPASDQYSLAVVGYEMLTGRRPFDAIEPMALAQQVMAGAAAPATSVRPALPAAVDAVLCRAMARAPGDRWPSVTAFAEALAGALAAATDSGSTPPGTLDGHGLLSRYDLGDVLGPGRFGSVVRRGTHRALATPVAIRHLKRAGQPHWEALRGRFLREARTLQVRHQHLLHVRDFGEDASGVFVVTDLVDGPSLHDVLGAGPLAWPRARRLILQMTDAAAALHQHGGLLTGVNPDTIRVTGDGSAERLVLTTGGIRAIADVLATLPEGQLRGQEASDAELPYLAPEVLTGRAPDPATDLFTLGVVAYQLIAGRVPYRAPSLPELIGQMLTMPAAAVAMPGVPPAAAAAIARCLAPDPSARGTLDELRVAVRPLGGG